MTLALYGKTRRRKSLLVLLALFAVLAATVSGAALRQSQLAQAASTASLLPIGDGGDSANWSAVPSGTAWSKVTEGSCGADTSYVTTTTDNARISFDIDESSIPNGSTITRVDVTFCYSDHDTSNDDESVRAYAKTEGNNTNGTEISFGGSTTPTLATTQQIDVADFVKSDSTDIEIGVQSRGADDIRVYAIWAVVQYTVPGVPDVTVTKAASASPVNQGQSFNWTVTIAAANSNATWAAGATVLTDQLPTTGATYGSPTDNAGSALTCSIDNGTQVLTCTAGGSGLTINSGSSAVVTIPVTPTATGTLQNPKSGGTCSVAQATGETNTANNSCNTSTVTVNAASNSDLCHGGSLNACIALLHDHNGPQTNPANSCAGIDANFVIDRSASIDSSELSALKGGITSFASALAGGSKFSGTQFSTTAEGITGGYVSAATFNTAVNGIATQLYTWTEGGIQVGAANNANDTVNPDMMFIVTDGSPNATDGSGTANTSEMLNWVNAANDAIDAANVARGSYVVRAVFAGDADPNIPLATTGDKQAFANAVLTRIGGGSFLQGAWSEIAANLLLSAGCDPTVNKAAGVPSNLVAGKYTTVDWAITLTNTAAAAKTVTVTDTGSTFLSATPSGACTPTTVGGGGPWSCTIPAKANNQNGLVTLNVRTTVPDYNVCTGTSGSNTVAVSGGATGQSTAPFTIAGNPNAPSCLGTIVVHKEIGAGAFATPPATWNFSLSGTGTGTTTIPVAGGQSSFTSLQPGTYTVTETNGATTGCASTSPTGSFWTTHGTATNPSAIGTAESGITVAAGETKHVYFKNTPCPGFLAISKTSSPQDTVVAGGSATWTITVNVQVNPTTSAWTISDTLPTGFVVSAAGITDDSTSVTCTPTAAGTTAFSCTLAANAPVGAYKITVPVTAPANFPMANCKAYTNSATIAGGTGSVIDGSATASDSITVTGCVNPSLALSKSNDLSGPLGSAGTFNWKVKATITNGPTIAAATIVDTLPAGFTFNGTITFTGSQDASKLSCQSPVGQGVTCTLASGAANGDYFLIIPVKAPAVTSSTQCGNATNSATASFPADQGAVTGSPATNQVTITCPSLTIAKTANPVGPVNLGSPIGFDLTITNTSTVVATGVSVSDTLPNVAGVVWSTVTAGCGVTSNSLTCSGLTVGANNGTFVVHVTGSTTGVTTRAACGPITNDSATATVIGVTSTSGSASVTVNCPSITLAKVANPAGSVNAGANIGWTFTVTNTTAVVATNVSVSDALPTHAGVNWLPAAPTTSGTGTCSVAGGVLSCTGLTVPAGGSITVSVTGTTTATGANKTCGLIENTGAVATLLGTNSNQLAAASVTVNCPDPSVGKSGNGPVTAGDNLVFTVTVTAGGTGTQSVVLTDTMPGTGLSWTKGGADAANCTPAGPLNSGSMYTCTFNNLNPGNTRTVTFTAPSNPAMCAQPALQNTANIAAAAGSVDTNDSNNSASATIAVNCPNVTLTKVADTPTTVSAGDQIGFTITATNSGAGIAHGFALTDNLPANVSWSISPANPNCAISAGVLKCPASGTTDLAANGGSISVHIVGTTTPAACGTVSNTVSAVVSNQANAIPSVTAQVTVNCPDLVVLKTADNGTINAGDTAAFTIVVTNNGTGTAKNVTLTDLLPSGVTWSEDSANCTILSGSLDCDWPNIAAGGTRTVHVTGPTAKANCGLLRNSVVVGASNEANTGNNSSRADIAVNCAEISVLKTPDATPVNATDGVGFTITATNNGTGSAYGVTITDSLPSASGLTWTESPDNGDCTISSSTLTCTFGTLASGASKSVHISSPTTVATCGTLNNTAAVATTNDGSGQSATSIVVNCPNVTVSKTKAPGQADPVSAGDTISFQIQVTVSGAGTAYNVTASDTLPANSSQWVVTNDPSAATACGVLVNQLSCNFGNVTSPKTFTITVTGKAIGVNGAVTCGPLSNTATVAAGNESNTNDNSSTATIGVNCPSVSISKTASNSPINAGDVAEFVITASNSGAGTATGVAVSDSLPTSGNLSWAVNPAVPGCGIVSGVLSCSFDSLAPSASVPIHVSATTNPASCGVLNNYAYVSAANDNVAGQTESNLASITVNCPDLSLTKTGASPINAGDTASFTLTVRNVSTTGSAYGVTLQDQLPAPAIGWADDSAQCSIDGSGLLTCTIGTLAPAGTFSVTVSGKTTPAQCGALPNTASTSATNEASSALANNSASATITVNCPEVKVVKTPDGSGINAGDEASFTMVVSNIGAGTAYTVTLSDTLPAGFSWNDDSDACDINAGVLNCAWTQIAAGGSESVTVTAPTSAAQCGGVENTALAAASNEAQAAGANNQDSGSITIACPDVDIVKTAVNDPINPGEDAKFAITVSNAGPGTAYGIVLTDVLPAGLTWTADNTTNCEIVSGTLTCKWKTLPAGQHLEVGLSAPTTTAQCGTLSNTASITVLNEAESLSEDNTSSDTIVVACGTIQVIKIDSVAENDPERPTDWDFTITGPNGFNESRSIALGGGSVTIANVPLGSGYAVSEVQAKFGACPQPNEAGTYRTTANNGPQNLTAAGQTISFSFNNQECGIVASIGMLVINKVSDTNGNHAQDAGEIGLAGWPVTVTGPEFPSGQAFVTGANGQLVLPGIRTGAYTISEGSQAGYQAVGVVTDDNGPVFSTGTSTGVNLEYSDTDVVTFFNRPLGSILVNKTTQVLLNGVVAPQPQDRDGWIIRVTSAACGVSVTRTTDVQGDALFTGLPMCSDYVVSEDLNTPGAPNYTPAGPASVSNVTPGAGTATRLNFVNQRVVTTCQDCTTQPTPTPATPPATNTPAATNTPQPTVPQPTVTPSPVSTTAGERTPGAATPTPIAPSTGAGWTAGAVNGTNMLLVIVGLFAVTGGLVFLSLGRKR
ncbi:MAG: CARDB domain-containing protein [Dehalococcoidia bacterium]